MLKRPRGNVLKIREFELEKINLIDEFDILQIVGEGWFGKILLVEHRPTQTEMVLKAVPKPYVSVRDFYREFHYGLHLGIHRNIVTTYDVAFETAGFYVFAQEYAPLGDLTSNVTDTGVGEVYSKRVAKQIASALDFIHSKDIVHRDVKLDNVLIYRSDFTRVKLCDFGESHQNGSIVERRNEWLPYSPPEVLEIKPEGTYKADPSHDVWQFGIVIFVCLTGCLPWQKASSDDPRYVRYLTWHNSMMPIRRTPKLFKLLTSRAQRMFRRFLEPRQDRRPKNCADLTKLLDDRWLAKTAEKEMAEYETDELCPSMYSFHSSPDEKHRLLYTLADCGIETNVDRQSKKNRIKDWIESSVITEEDEEEEDTHSASPSSSVSREPVPGHISSIRTNSNKAKEIKSTLKDATQKHFDPRTGALQQGPSEMGATMTMMRDSVSPALSNSSMKNNDSLSGSILTLGSRQDLIGSSTQVFNSDMNLHHLGMNLSEQEQPNLSLSSDNLLHSASNEAASALQNPQLAKSIRPAYARRSRSDSVRLAMSVSSPAIDQVATNILPKPFTTNLIKGFTPNGSAFFGSKAVGTPLQVSNQANSMQSVTASGLASAFQAIAPLPLPANTNNNVRQLQAQQLINSNPNNHSLNSSVKDSAYGSTDVHEGSSSNLQINGNFNESQGKSPTRSHHPQQQQQQFYRGAQTSTMKDSPYDHITIRTKTRKRR